MSYLVLLLVLIPESPIKLLSFRWWASLSDCHFFCTLPHDGIFLKDLSVLDCQVLNCSGHKFHFTTLKVIQREIQFSSPEIDPTYSRFIPAHQCSLYYNIIISWSYITARVAGYADYWKCLMLVILKNDTLYP